MLDAEIGSYFKMFVEKMELKDNGCKNYSEIYAIYSSQYALFMNCLDPLQNIQNLSSENIRVDKPFQSHKGLHLQQNLPPASPVPSHSCLWP